MVTGPEMTCDPERVFSKCADGIRLVTICFFALFIFSGTCPADTLYTKDGRIIKGVVVEKGPGRVILATASGEKSFKETEIDKIAYDDTKNNLLMLADIAKHQKEYIKAYYLYEKLLKLDPDFERAWEELQSLEPYVEAKKKDVKWVSDYQRYSPSDDSKKTEGQVLSEKSDETEELLDKFGLILEMEGGRIKVQEVVKASRADNAGIEINDFLVDIAGIKSDYLGLFDAVSYLLKKEGGIIPVTVEREIKLWAGPVEESAGFSLWDSLGISFIARSGMLEVSDLKATSTAYQGGLREADGVLSINTHAATGLSALDAIQKNVMNTIPGYLDLIIRRRLNL